MNEFLASFGTLDFTLEQRKFLMALAYNLVAQEHGISAQAMEMFVNAVGPAPSGNGKLAPALSGNRLDLSGPVVADNSLPQVLMTAAGVAHISPSRTRAALAEAKEKKVGDLKADLNTIGGHLIAGNSVKNALEDYRKETGKRVDITAGTLVASAGTPISAAGNSFTVRENTAYMIHDVHAKGETEAGLTKLAGVAGTLSNALSRELASRWDKKPDEVRTQMKAETWMAGQEIVDKGYANKVEEAPQSEPAPAPAPETPEASNDLTLDALMKSGVLGSTNQLFTLLPKEQREEGVA